MAADVPPAAAGVVGVVQDVVAAVVGAPDALAVMVAIADQLLKARTESLLPL